MQCIRAPRCASTLTLSAGRQGWISAFAFTGSNNHLCCEMTGLKVEKNKVCWDRTDVNVAILSKSEDLSASGMAESYWVHLYITWHSDASNNHGYWNKNNTASECQDAKWGSRLGAHGWKVKFPFSLPPMPEPKRRDECFWNPSNICALVFSSISTSRICICGTAWD